MPKKASDARASVGKVTVIATLGRVGRWTLVVIVLGLALIGLLHLTRGTAVRRVRGVTADGAAISVSEPEFPLMATMATGAWLAPGNRVQIMLNGDGTYARLWEDLRSAQRSITLQLYYGAPGRMADTLSEILRERAKAGVRVLVLYDAFGTVDIPANHRDQLVGSMNFDNRSMALNDEATLMVLENTAGQRMNRIFLDDLRHAEEITLETFRQRSWLERIAEWGANSLTRLL